MFKILKKKKEDIFLNRIIKERNVYIGDYTYGRIKIKKFDDFTKLKIGKFCSFADKVTFLLGGEHNIDWISTFPFNEFFSEKIEEKIIGHPASKGDIIVGNDVWIGYGSLILSGVTIGHGAIIGANSVVTKDIPAYAIAAGNPVKIYKRRFSEEIIKKMLEIAWWNWNIDKILKNASLLQSPNIEEFIKLYEK